MNDINQYILFKAGQEEYAAHILNINEVIRMKGINITGVPNTPSYVIGIINLRGEVVPIIDLRTRFNIKESATQEDNRILITNLNDRIVGILVDCVTEVSMIDSQDISEPPEEISDINNQYIMGVTQIKDRLVIILDIERIIYEKDKETIETVGK